MGLYASDHPDVPGMKGLQLFHYVMSNCSQRVRLALEEKGLEWTSHHVDLPANEHVTPDYQRINPNGVVPTLVHDGQVVIESNDILEYLDEHFPEPPLRPADPEERGGCQALVEASSAFQSSIKVLSHDRLFRPFRKLGESELELYDREHNDPKLAAFMHDYMEDGEAWRKRVEAAEAALTRVLDLLEDRLVDRPWLSGDGYGLADVSWVVNANRLIQTRVELEGWPKLAAWAEKAMARPAFERAVVAWRPS